MENAVAKAFQGYSWMDAYRVPGSGAMRDWPHDIRLRINVGDRWKEWGGECKKRANGEGFAQLDRWLGGADALFLAADRQAPRVYIYATVLQEMLEAAYEAGRNDVSAT